MSLIGPGHSHIGLNPEFVHPRPAIREHEVILCKAITRGTQSINEIQDAVTAYISIRDFYEKKLAAANTLAGAVAAYLDPNSNDNNDHEVLGEALQTYGYAVNYV